MIDLHRGSPSSASTSDFYPAYLDPNRDLIFHPSSDSSSTIRLSSDDDDFEYDNTTQTKAELASTNDTRECHELSSNIANKACIFETSRSNTDRKRDTIFDMDNGDDLSQNLFITNDIAEGTNSHQMTPVGDDYVSLNQGHSSGDNKKRWLRWKKLSRKIKRTFSKKKRNPEDARTTKWKAMKRWVHSKNVFSRYSRE